jgi:hypothetical protein
MNQGVRTKGSLVPVAGLALMLVTVVLALVGEGTASAAGAPTVSVTPASSKGAFADQQVVKVAVGANSLFTPNSRVVILECTDPGGSAANLPISYSSCDGNTIQPDTTVVHADGSFVEPSYLLYALPSAALGEQANWQPVCNASHPCVLFIGEDQNDFSKAKVFSAAFTMSGGAPASATSAASTALAPAPASTQAPVSAAVSLPGTQLAFTGTSHWLLELVALGLFLVVVALALASVVRRSAR